MSLLNITNIPSNSVRVPEPVAGTASHPDPFPPPTPLVRKVHLQLETPGSEAPLLEDGDALEALLAQTQR
jgi:hypothetical protein